MSNGKGWYGVDLDGTLVSSTNGGPIAAMVERVDGWLQEDREVRIVTARVARNNASDLIEEARGQIAAWSLLHLGRTLESTSEKDYGMVELWDDRARQVVPNTGELAVDVAREWGKQAIIDAMKLLLTQPGQSDAQRVAAMRKAVGLR